MDKHTAVKAFVGLDVHADTITIAVAEGDSRARARSVGTIPNRRDKIRKALGKLGSPQELEVCYEAGPCGYGLYRQLSELGIRCEVVAPTLVPVRAGERVKTDARDARKLAQSLRAGELTPVWVPDEAHEALRDLVRAREDAKADQLRARQRLTKFLLRQGVRRPSGMKAWTQKHRQWLRTQHFEQLAHQHVFTDYVAEVDKATERVAQLERAIAEAIEVAPASQREVIQALQSLRGVGLITAVTLVAEVGSFARFNHPGGCRYEVAAETSSGSGWVERRPHRGRAGKKAALTGVAMGQRR